MAPKSPQEFFISRRARDRYGIPETLPVPVRGDLSSSFRSARLLFERIREGRAREPGPEPRASELNALGVLDAVFHRVLALYGERVRPSAFAEALEQVRAGSEGRDPAEVFEAFRNAFPPAARYRGEPAADEGAAAKGDAARELVEEILLLWVANRNPAIRPYLDLVDESPVGAEGAYDRMVAALRSFFRTMPPFGPDAQDLVEMLLSPARAVPHSLVGQLEYIRARWGFLVEDFLPLLLRGMDLAREEDKARLARPAPGGAATPVPDYAGLQAEPEAYTPDRDWMPNVVLIAKNTHVWLDQLSRARGREIRRLDQVPDEELGRLSAWGFTGLWLIGVWERGAASREIKRRCGNPEALASAYSVADYEVAGELGGDEAFRALKARALARGVRMSTDMVPNHTAIDSKWMVQRPGLFLSLGRSPYPVYRFDGPDLSPSPEVGIFLESHYWERSDAAVVFRRLDRRTGEERFVYHGNDGTSMPWNDTAQLDFLNPETREAVAGEILRVAAKSPIIRFDAAMVLAKRHVQRLWHPEPGAGGAVPSRAEHALPRAEFEARLPAEFWRDVVDRVQREAPDTLLLAEAFWLLEGYFVRTLGMHRVYNSAFMNMLKNEDNAKFRSVLKNTLEFDPEVLKRFVNFMSNPDEDTAVAQFGKGDKYFGVCTMLVTLPGLPMFAHGQIEGFVEKYGMEYRRAYYDEKPDEELVRRHEREIFPLLRRRRLFAESANFLLYDLFTPSGHVDEDVFAYSNRRGAERALVVVHNRYAEASGWIRTSVAFAEKDPAGATRLVRRTLREGLAIEPRAGAFWAFRDHASGLEFLRRSEELAERGLYVELGAYRRLVFLDFREVRDAPEAPWAALASRIGYAGVASLDRALHELRLDGLREAFRGLCAPAFLRTALGAPVPGPSWLETLERGMESVLREARGFAPAAGDPSAAARRARDRAAGVFAAPPATPAGEAETLAAPESPAREAWGTDRVARAGALGWALLSAVGDLEGAEAGAGRASQRADEWGLGAVYEESVRGAGLDGGEASAGSLLARVLLRHEDAFRQSAGGGAPVSAFLGGVFEDPEARAFLGVNSWEGVWWLGKEPWVRLLAALAAVAVAGQPAGAAGEGGPLRDAAFSLADSLVRAGEASRWRVHPLRDCTPPSGLEPT